MARITVERANYNPLLKFAIAQGLDVRHGIKGDDLIATINAAFPGVTEVEVDEDDIPQAVPVDATAGRKGTDPAHYSNDPKVTITIPSSDTNGGRAPFPISVNGDSILVSRDVEVKIPYRHYLVLKNAKEEVYTQSFDAGARRYTEHKSIQPAVPFSVTEMPSQAEIAAFHERTKDLGREVVKAAA